MADREDVEWNELEMIERILQTEKEVEDLAGQMAVLREQLSAARAEIATLRAEQDLSTGQLTQRAVHHLAARGIPPAV